ncbi:hypothetical protein AB0B15_24965 [Streptomyces sp. NPDC045456]|uniref:hypothetical protein n=1 Tax=Streptomyces sp. NPDC045456 TaxID=3155254 RepID=UPI0033C7CD2B
MTGASGSRRRGRAGLLVQFVAQWVYLPVWAAASLALAVVVALASAGLNPPKSWFNPARGLLSWSRLKAEWSHDPEVWRAYADGKLTSRLRKAENNQALYTSHPSEGEQRQVSVILPVRFFRGVGAEHAVSTAQSLGWSAEVLPAERGQWHPGAVRAFRSAEAEASADHA